MSAFLGILIFSLIETLTVVIWGMLLGVGNNLDTATKIIAGVVLFAGYVVEHIVAFNVGKGRSLLSFPTQ